MGFRNRKTRNLLMLLAVMFVLVGCKANLNPDGTLIAERAINASTPWSFSAGWFDFLIVIPIAKLMLFLEPFAGIVVALILVTVVLNAAIMPLMIKSSVMSQKVQLLQPQMDRIQNKYRGRNDQASKARMSMEITNLYKKHNIKMGQTMLMPFLSMPIMLGMWQAVQRIELMYEASFLGFNMGALPWGEITSGNYAYLFLIIALGILQYLSVDIQNMLQKRSKNYKPAKGNKSMKFMSIYMTGLIVIFSLNMPAAMSIYWIITSLIGIARSVYIHYRFTDRMLLKEDTNYLTKKNKR